MGLGFRMDQGLPFYCKGLGAAIDLPPEISLEFLVLPILH